MNMYISRKLVAVVVAGMIFVLQFGGLAPTSEEGKASLPRFGITASAEDLKNGEEMQPEVTDSMNVDTTVDGAIVETSVAEDIENAVDLQFTEEQVAFLEQFVDDNGNHFSVDDWEKYLAEGGITTDDNGNIVVDTFETFEHFSLGYQKYCESNGVMYSIKEARTRVMSRNLSEMSTDLKTYLMDKYLVLVDIFDTPIQITDISQKTYDRNVDFAKANCQNRMVLESILDFNKGNRDVGISMDQLVYNYISSLQKDEQNSLPDYIYSLGEIRDIAIGKSERFGDLAEISYSAPYIFLLSAFEIGDIVREGGGMPLLELSLIINIEEEAVKKAAESFYTSFEYDAATN